MFAAMVIVLWDAFDYHGTADTKGRRHFQPNVQLMISSNASVRINYFILLVKLIIAFIRANSADPGEMPHMEHFILWVFTVYQGTCI